MGPASRSNRGQRGNLQPDTEQAERTGNLARSLFLQLDPILFSFFLFPRLQSGDLQCRERKQSLGCRGENATQSLESKRDLEKQA